MSDTIFALASGMGRAGVAVLRVSRPQSWDSMKALTRKFDFTPPMSFLCALSQPDSRETLDQALVLPFKSPASYTGEDVVEYHLHGGRAVIESVLAALEMQPSHRMAEPGEFTRRGFENGKMDLTEAEAVADLIDAETQAQKAQALHQMGGALSDLYEGWMERLKKTLAHLEADIEFPDEDLPDELSPEILLHVEALKSEMFDHLHDNRRGERLRDGIQVAVIGAPNAGKSSLVNVLAQRDVAIISDMAGTTRDVIEAHLDLGGYPVVLADTAGLRPDQIGSTGHEAVESEGIRRALERAKNADIKLLVFDAGEATLDAHTLDLRDDRAILVLNKSEHLQGINTPDGSVTISVKENTGIQDLLGVLEAKIADLMQVSQEAPSLTRKRHRAFVEEAHGALLRATSAELPELIAEDIRLSVRALGRITGRVDVEDLLDVIFKDFCIGK